MPHSVGLDVSQKTTAIGVVEAEGRRVWRGACPTDPGQILQLVSKHAGSDAKSGVETGAIARSNRKGSTATSSIQHQWQPDGDAGARTPTGSTARPCCGPSSPTPERNLCRVRKDANRATRTRGLLGRCG
jgi:hypothetical protein